MKDRRANEAPVATAYPAPQQEGQTRRQTKESYRGGAGFAPIQIHIGDYPAHSSPIVNGFTVVEKLSNAIGGQRPPTQVTCPLELRHGDS